MQEGVRERGEEDQGKRRELSEKFSTTINEITARMESQQQERLRVAGENDQFGPSPPSPTFGPSPLTPTPSTPTPPVAPRPSPL